MHTNVIYDVGAHVGEDTEFYLKKGFKVVAVEANPALVSYLKERFHANLSDGSLVIVDSAIADKSGMVSFYVNERSCWGTIDFAFAERNAMLGCPSQVDQVQAVTFTEVLRQYGVPYYLKIDIEGADTLCLKGLAESPEKPRYMSIESDKRSWKALMQEFQLLKSLGYSKFKIVDQALVPQQRTPSPSVEGRDVSHVFEPGASGLFGGELPGKWLTMGQAIRRYRLIYLSYYLSGDSGILHRARLKFSGSEDRKSDHCQRRRSPLRCALNKIATNPSIKSLLKAHWYDTHATV
jgi:FkbM family methyltransferase